MRRGWRGWAAALAFALMLAGSVAAEPSFPGWYGEVSHDSQQPGTTGAGQDQVLIQTIGLVNCRGALCRACAWAPRFSMNGRWRPQVPVPKITVMHPWAPRVFHFEGFLT